VKAKIYVTLKKGVLDPQGRAILSSLSHLGMEGVEDVRVGKYMELVLKDIGRDESQRLLDDACRRLLANTVIEDYRIEIEG
jgi:phosphoribosylformylglycinamidine synthase